MMASATTADFRVDPYTAYAVPTGPHYAYPDRVVTGDVTGDGRADIVLTTVGLNSLDTDAHVAIIFAQQTDGTLAPPVRIHYLQLASRTGLELADLDSDGAQEIIVGHGAGLTVINRDQVGFAATLVTNSRPAWYLGVLDADRDGNPDIVAQTWSDGASIYFGDGRRGFDQVMPFPTPAFGYNTVEVQDLTRDGFKDLILTNGQGSPKFWVFPVDRVNGLGAPIAYDVSSQMRFPSFGIAVADFDNDGRPDVVMSDLGPPPEQGPGLRILYMDAQGQLSRAIKLPSSRGPGAISTVDLDGNGLMDVVSLQNSWNTMQYHLQHQGGFQAPVEMTTTTTPWLNGFYHDNSLAVGDVNSDGCMDILVADSSSGLLVYPTRNCIKPRPTWMVCENP